MLLVLFPDGDSITRSNEVETTYRRVNPRIWWRMRAQTPRLRRGLAYYAALADEKGRCDMSDFPFGGEYRA